ncbi:unnamed protein product [Darwinula stevensoni]|uniref:SH3 domain-containing protein n=1 Tax=Darwinula stevensoni TaxID=69355 RepID=A0A7R9ADE7_9CRUS|nr:unnamed protein product [Darwinula stevensoni]CAG0900909.1 unnamed protein product [Darwinula stevensoni]
MFWLDSLNIVLDRAWRHRALWKELAGYESDSTLVFRRKEDLSSSQEVEPGQQKLWYREVQRGGEVPLTGLRKPAPEKPAEEEAMWGGNTRVHRHIQTWNPPLRRSRSAPSYPPLFSQLKRTSPSRAFSSLSRTPVSLSSLRSPSFEAEEQARAERVEREYREQVQKMKDDLENAGREPEPENLVRVSSKAMFSSAVQAGLQPDDVDSESKSLEVEARYSPRGVEMYPNVKQAASKPGAAKKDRQRKDNPDAKRRAPVRETKTRRTVVELKAEGPRKRARSSSASRCPACNPDLVGGPRGPCTEKHHLSRKKRPVATKKTEDKPPPRSRGIKTTKFTASIKSGSDANPPVPPPRMQRPTSPRLLRRGASSPKILPDGKIPPGLQPQEQTSSDPPQEQTNSDPPPRTDEHRPTPINKSEPSLTAYLTERRPVSDSKFRDRDPRPSRRIIDSLKSTTLPRTGSSIANRVLCFEESYTPIPKSTLLVHAAKDQIARKEERERRRSRDSSPSVDSQEYQRYILELFHSTPKSDRFLKLKKFYANLEKIARIEKTCSTADLIQLSRENMIDFETWKRFRTVERAQDELKALYKELDEAQTQREFQYKAKDQKSLRWHGDVSLRLRDSSMEDLKEKFATMEFRRATVKRRHSHLDTYKPLLRSNSVLDLTHKYDSLERMAKLESYCEYRRFSNEQLYYDSWPASMITVSAMRDAEISDLRVRAASEPHPMSQKESNVLSKSSSISSPRHLGDKAATLPAPTKKRDDPACKEAISEREKRNLSRKLSEELQEKFQKRAQRHSDPRPGMLETPRTMTSFASSDGSDQSFLSQDKSNFVLVLKPPGDGKEPNLSDIERSVDKVINGDHSESSSSVTSVSTVINRDVFSKVRYYERKAFKARKNAVPKVIGPTHGDVRRLRHSIEMIAEREAARTQDIYGTLPRGTGGRSPEGKKHGHSKSLASLNDLDRDSPPANGSADRHTPPELLPNYVPERTVSTLDLSGEAAEYPAPFAKMHEKVNPIGDSSVFDGESGGHSLPPLDAESTKYWRTYLTKVKAGDVRRLKEKLESRNVIYPSPVDYRSPRHSPSSSPHREKADVHSRTGPIVIRRHETADVDRLKWKYEHEGRARVRSTCNRTTTLNRYDRPFVPRTKIISKIVALQRSKSKSPPRDGTWEQYRKRILENRVLRGGLRGGKVGQLRSKFEAFYLAQNKDISLLGHMYTSTPDLCELREIPQSIRLTRPFREDMYRAVPAQVTDREPSNRRNPVQNVVGPQTYSTFDPAKHRPVSRYVPIESYSPPLKTSTPVPMYHTLPRANTTPVPTYRTVPRANSTPVPTYHTVPRANSTPVPMYNTVPRANTGRRLPSPVHREPLIGPIPTPKSQSFGSLPSDCRPFDRAASPHKYNEGQVNIHYRTPVRALEKEFIPEDELRRRQASQMRRLYEEERHRKFLQELQDQEMRRHQDFLSPTQKTQLIPLDRYDNLFDDSRPRSRDRDRLTPDSKTIGRALHDFIAQSSRYDVWELSIRKGDLVYIRRQVDPNWYEGEHNAMHGIFPVSYVELIPYDEATSGTTAKRVAEGQARARYHFQAHTPLELPLIKGELVALTRRVDANWWEGRIGSKRGIFPDSYVEILVPPGVERHGTSVTKPVASPAAHSLIMNGSVATPAPAPPPSQRPNDYTYAPAGPRQSGYTGSPSRQLGYSTGSAYRTDSGPGSTSPSRQPGGYMPRSTSPIRQPGGYVPRPTSPTRQPSGYMPRPTSPTRQPSGYVPRSVSPPRHSGHVPRPASPSRYHGNAPRSRTTTSRTYAYARSYGQEPGRPTMHVEVNSEPVPYRALYDYLPVNEDELELREGDVVYVLEKCDDGWYVGTSQRTGLFGTFPGNYVQRL